MRWRPFLGIAVGAALVTWLASTGPQLAEATQDAGEKPKAKATPAGTGTVTGKVVFPKASKRKRRVRRRYPGQSPGAKKGQKASWFPAVVFVEDVTGGTAPKGTKAVMEQEGIAFDPAVLPVRVGTTVTFPNLDPVYHNVLSYSTAKRFDLGRYAQGETRTVTFDKQGVVRLACEIHEHMKGYIVVLRHPHFAASDAKGGFTLPGVPAGTHRIAVWHDKFKFDPVTVTVTAGKPVSVTLTGRPK